MFRWLKILPFVTPNIRSLVKMTSSTFGLFDNIPSLFNLCCQSAVYTKTHLVLQEYLLQVVYYFTVIQL